MPDELFCESCGMAMRTRQDFGGGILTNRYCRHCTDERGNLRDFEACLADLARFVMDRIGADPDRAVQIARENMARMPAWKARFPSEAR